jgi:hypothetical protein
VLLLCSSCYLFTSFKHFSLLCCCHPTSNPLKSLDLLPCVQTSQQQVNATDTALTQVDGDAVNLQARRCKLPIDPGDAGLVTLKLRPVGMHVHIASLNELLILIKQLLLTLTALHKHKWVHRDVRMDNLVHGPTGWVLIDWELAGPAGQHVFWNSTHLPPEVNTGQMPYTAASDLWQVGRVIQRYDALSTGATKQFASQLISKQFTSAGHALSAMPEI